MLCRILLLALASTAAAQQLEYTVLKEGVLQERLRLASPKNAERYSRLKVLFEQSGCRSEDLREQTVKGSKEPNLICSVPGTGESRRRIVVGSHFDSDAGEGVIDNWSGAVLLPSLSEFLRVRPRRHEFEFVAFAGEEKGLLGSRTFLKSIPKNEREQIAGVVTMDSLGLSPTKCWPNGSSKELVAAAAVVAQTLKLDFRGVNMDRVGTTDSETFKEAHIPVLSLHSVTQETLGFVHSSKDRWPAVSWNDYYDTHRLLSALLVYLDSSLP